MVFKIKNQNPFKIESRQYNNMWQHIMYAIFNIITINYYTENYNM